MHIYIYIYYILTCVNVIYYISYFGHHKELTIKKQPFFFLFLAIINTKVKTGSIRILFYFESPDD